VGSAGGAIGPNGQIYNMHSSFQAQSMNHDGLSNVVQNSQAHVINQSLKPKMIMNNNAAIPMQPGKGMHGSQMPQQTFQQHQAHVGDTTHISSSNPRPASSKVVKKKSTVGSTGGNQLLMQQ